MIWLQILKCRKALTRSLNWSDRVLDRSIGSLRMTLPKVATSDSVGLRRKLCCPVSLPSVSMMSSIALVTLTLNPLMAYVADAIFPHILFEDWKVLRLRPKLLYGLCHIHSIGNRLSHYDYCFSVTIIIVDRILCGTELSGRVGGGQIAGRQ